MTTLSKVLALLCFCSAGLAATRPFSLTVEGQTSASSIRSAFVLPGKEIRLSAPEAFRSLEVKNGALSKTLRWTAPQDPGRYPIRLRAEGGEQVLLNVFVLVPHQAVREGKLRGYRIGKYPNGKGAYERPRGFIEVTHSMLGEKVSPHFTIGQFLCKQAGGYPKYLALTERLILKLERVLEKLNAKSVKAETLFVMSGFRTPSYNRALGNVGKSRHLYGDAADIFVDSHPRDGKMDDLNGDGRSDLKDSQFLKNVVQAVESEEGSGVTVGGLGLYKATHSHGPFVHVDARGHAARWSGTGVASAERPAPQRPQKKG
jgi:hypothetical protein